MVGIDLEAQVYVLELNGKFMHQAKVDFNLEQEDMTADDLIPFVRFDCGEKQSEDDIYGYWHLDCYFNPYFIIFTFV